MDIYILENVGWDAASGSATPHLSFLDAAREASRWGGWKKVGEDTWEATRYKTFRNIWRPTLFGEVVKQISKHTVEVHR